ncbi:MAG: DUF4386 domain-containing protein [Bacteroidetes bacterium]|nr:DUF4386 domain-containing protein [Bacteroidota bacterium]
MNNPKSTARLAGALYLIVVVAGIINLMYVPSKLIVRSDAALTVKNIIESESLFKFGIVAGVLCYTAFLLLPLVLYKLLKDVNNDFAVAMVALAIVSVPFSLVNLLNKMSVLTLIDGKQYLVTLADQLQAQVFQYLDFYSTGISLISIFWGLWLFPFGFLVYKSGFLPKVLGALLMAGCFGYLINFFGSFFSEAYQNSVVADYISLPAAVGEIGTCLWLLIFGVKTKSVN